jgi:hypothetical protein
MIIKVYIKHSIPLLLMLALFISLQSCSDSYDRSPFEPEFIGNDIKDTTAGGISILGGTIGHTTASIGFSFINDGSEDYNVWMLLGTTDSTYGFKEILNKHPNNFVSGVSNAYHFKSLVPNKTYYATIMREVGIDSWRITVQFTTKSEK